MNHDEHRRLMDLIARASRDFLSRLRDPATRVEACRELVAAHEETAVKSLGHDIDAWNSEATDADA